MRKRALDWLIAAGLVGLAAPALAQTQQPLQQQPEHGSIEQDYREERQEGLQARQQASERRSWRAPDWRPEPVVSVNILGINDFHGQLSPRSVAGRPAGGAAVLASYLKSASREYTLIVHDGDQVGASPPNSALLRDEPAISLLNLLANPFCRPFGWQMELSRRAQTLAQQRCKLPAERTKARIIDRDRRNGTTLFLTTDRVGQPKHCAPFDRSYSVASWISIERTWLER